MDLLPDFEKQQDGTAKIAFKWVNEPLKFIDMQALAIDTFGKGILDINNFVYRTLHIKLKTGEAKCFVVYDKFKK